MKTLSTRAGKLKLALFLTLCAVVLGCAVFLCFNISNKHNTTTASAATSVEMPVLTGMANQTGVTSYLSGDGRTLTAYLDVDNNSTRINQIYARNIVFRGENHFTMSGSMDFGGYFYVSGLGKHTCTCTLESGYI